MADTFNNTIIIQTGQCRQPSTKAKPKRLNNRSLAIALVQNTYGAKMSKNERMLDSAFDAIDTDTIKILPGSAISTTVDAIHSGLLQYAHIAWADEVGVILSPDQFHYTVISEVKAHIIEHPDQFKHFFTEDSGSGSDSTKETINVHNLTVEKLLTVLEQKIPHKELFNLITRTHYLSAPDNFKLVTAITMANMATPYYDYVDTKCGIPHVAVRGSRDEWQLLADTINKLAVIFAQANDLRRYFGGVEGTIQTLIATVFGPTSIEAKQSLFANMFQHQNNQNCGSGHAQTIVTGWLRTLYMLFYSTVADEIKDDIKKYPSHLNCLPYTNKDDPTDTRYYFYVTGLTSSELVKYNSMTFYNPMYDVVHCQMISKYAHNVYDRLSDN